jgi:hypothetical protein
MVGYKELQKLMSKLAPKSNEDRARAGILDLRKNLSAREGKYIRNMNRYMNNGVRREDLWTPYVWPQAYVTPAQNTDGVQTQFNLIKSCIDALTAKVSEARVRPYFNPLHGDYDTNRACKALQQHFDFWLDEQKAYEKSISCFRDSAIFDIGVMYVDAEKLTLERVPPWEYFIDPAEYMHHTVTHVLRWRKHFPLAYAIGDMENPKLKDRLAMDFHDRDEYAEYYDLYNGKKWEFYGSQLIHEPVDLDYKETNGLYQRPYREIYYTEPLKGFFSQSLADSLYPVQREVDELVRRFDNATRNMPLALAFVPKGSGLKASQLNNAVTAYDVLSGGENGQVNFVTPSPMSQEWIQLLEMYIKKAYELEGISEMSAQSKKPADVESGKAMQTLEDIESDRFNVQLQRFTHFLVDISRLCIDVFPSGKTILPPKIMRDSVTWGDARRDSQKYSIQFSAASVLSKDPDRKMVQIQAMINGGFIDKSMASHFMQLPDLEGVQTILGAGYDAAQRVIDACLKDKDYEYWQTVDLTQLESEIVKQMNVLISVGDDEKYIKRLAELLEKVNQEKIMVNKFLQAPPPQPPPEPLKDKAFDSGQIKALSELIAQVNAGSILPEQGVSVIATLFPTMPKQFLMHLFEKSSSMPQQGQGDTTGASPQGSGQSAPAPANAGNQMTGENNA